MLGVLAREWVKVASEHYGIAAPAVLLGLKTIGGNDGVCIDLKDDDKRCPILKQLRKIKSQIPGFDTASSLMVVAYLGKAARKRSYPLELLVTTVHEEAHVFQNAIFYSKELQAKYPSDAYWINVTRRGYKTAARLGREDDRFSLSRFVEQDAEYAERCASKYILETI